MITVNPSTLHQAVTEAMKTASLQPQDQAAAALALEYASTIDDDPEALDPLGPKLLAVLVALGMTPSGRSAKGGTKDAGPITNPLDQLAQQRAKRAG